MHIAVFHIAVNTFRENLRQPIYLLVLLAALVLIGILPGCTLFVFREQEKLVTDTAMATMLVFGWVLAVLIASHSITQEIQRGTAVLLLSKPVTRLSFILGKTLGLLGGLVVFCLLTGGATIMTLRVAADQFDFHQAGFALYAVALLLGCAIGGIVNFVKRSSFPMATVLALLAIFPVVIVLYRFMPIHGTAAGYQLQVIPALVLVAFGVCTLGVLAVALSTRLGMIQNMLVCGVIFVAGLMSDYLLADLAARNIVAAVLHTAIPNWQLFWMADALAAGKLIPLSYVALGGLYFFLFTILLLTIAAIFFAHREVGGDRSY